jgi:DNA-binding SARP family transcriptional activator
MIEAPTSLEVTTLGRFEVRRDGHVLSGGNWNRRKVCELFKLLLSAEPHRLHREQIQEVLWPSFSSEQATNSFGKTLYLLRRAVEPELATSKGSASTYIALDHETLLLIPEIIQIDADQFEMSAKHLLGKLRGRVGATQHAHGAREAKGADGRSADETLDEVDRVLALYGGDYLPEDLYEDWAVRRRDRLMRTHSLLLEQAAELAIAGSMGQRASEYLRALLEHNNADELIHRQLMLVYARMGRRNEALSQYQQLREVLREELRTHPLPETIELYRTIQAGRISTDLVEMRITPLAELVAANTLQHTAPTAPATMPLPKTIHIHAHSAHDEHAEEHIQEQATGPEATKVLGPERILNAPLVGRKEEFQRLQHLYGLTLQGQARTAFINGEPGIGKSRLAREVTRWGIEQQAGVLWGYCYEMTGSLPYQPIVDALNAHMRTCNAEQLRNILGKSAVDLAKIAPELRAKLPDLPTPETLGSEVERHNLYNAVTHYLHALAAERPLVLILDDLQWADTATVQLLSYLTAQRVNIVREGAPLPFYLLLYRADEVHETHPMRGLLSSLLRIGHADEIRLKRLHEEDVQQLLINMAGHNVRMPFTDQIYKYTEGNPFFVGESIRSLVEEGKIKKIDDRWQMTVNLEDLELPQSVRLLIERRLVHLTPECRMTLAVAAVLGRQFSSALLCQARNLSEDSIAEHIDDAIRAQILMTVDMPIAASNSSRQEADLAFTHDKIREVLAQWLNPLRRRQAHRQVAQAIELHYATHLQPYYSKLAYHYQMVEDASKAVDYLLKAAEQAASVYAFVDTASYMEKAIELLIRDEDRAERAELLRRLSVDVYLYIGRPDKAVEAGIASCALWSDLGDAKKEAEARLDVAFSFHWMGHESEAITYIQRALSCLDTTEGEARLHAKAHAQWGLAATSMGNVPEALEHLGLADEQHARIGSNDPFIAVVTLWARSWCAFLSDTLQKMLEYALKSAELCRAIRMFAWEPMMTYSAAWAQMLLGRLEEGEKTAHDTVEKAQRHNAVGAQGWANLVMAFLEIQRARWDASRQYADTASAIATMMHESNLQSRVLWSRSICAGWQGEWERAVHYALEGIQLEARGETSMVHPHLLLQTAKAYFYAGHIPEAQRYLDDAMQLAQARQYRQLPACGQRLQGRILQTLGLFDKAQTYFEQALKAFTELEDPVEYTRTLEAYGLFFLKRKREGDHEHGSTLLAQARAQFDQLGVNG